MDACFSSMFSPKIISVVNHNSYLLNYHEHMTHSHLLILRTHLAAYVWLKTNVCCVYLLTWHHTAWSYTASSMTIYKNLYLFDYQDSTFWTSFKC